VNAYLWRLCIYLYNAMSYVVRLLLLCVLVGMLCGFFVSYRLAAPTRHIDHFLWHTSARLQQTTANVRAVVSTISCTVRYFAHALLDRYYAGSSIGLDIALRRVDATRFPTQPLPGDSGSSTVH